MFCFTGSGFVFLLILIMAATNWMETEHSAADSFSQSIVKTKQKCAFINNNKTELVCSVFEDYIFLIVTQFMKIGTLVHIFPENTVEGQRTSLITTKVLFGKDEPLTHIMAKNIYLGMSTTKSVMLSISLKDTSRETIAEINKLISQCKIWT